MKKSLFFLICLFAGYSCTDDIDPNDAYPRELQTVTRSITPRQNPYIDWEDTTKINIVGHGLVTLPWYNGAEGFIPDHVLQDYKRADGWELVYNFCSDEAENIGGNKNFLIFYNKLTGKLRVYYYSRNVVTNGTTTVAQFRTSSASRLFDFNSGYYSIPYNGGVGPIEVCTSNLTNSGSHATAYGWNCFEVELAYDPIATNEHLHIGFYDQNISKLTLSGILSFETDGTIITTNVENSLKPLLNLAGNAAGKAMQDAYVNAHKSKKSTKFGAALGSLGSKIVSSGLNLLFGSFLGRFDKEVELKSTVELKTEGKAEFTGKIQSNIASAIVPIQNLLIPGAPASEHDQLSPLYNMPLGAWNVLNLPTIRLDDVLTPTVYPVTPQPSGYKGYCVDYKRSLQKMPFGKEDIIINPETMACIDDYEVTVDYYVISKFNGEYCLADGGNYNQYLTKCVYEETYTDEEWNKVKENDHTPYTEEYRKIKTMFYELSDYAAEFENSSFSMPQYTFATWIDDDAILKSLQQTVKYKQPKTRYYTNYMAKVSLILYPKAPYNDKPILLTKTFKPNIILNTVTQRPIYIYNPYMKPPYVSSYDLWAQRWSWLTQN